MQTPLCADPTSSTSTFAEKSAIVGSECWFAEAQTCGALLGDGDSALPERGHGPSPLSGNTSAHSPTVIDLLFNLATLLDF